MKLNKTAATGAFGVLIGAAVLATPAFACSPNARIRTNTGISGPGTEVAVTGEQWYSGSTVELRWDTEDGQPVGESIAGPSFATQVQIPENATPGFHYILAVQRDGFRVTRAATIEVTAPPVDPDVVAPDPVVVDEPVAGGPDATEPAVGGPGLSGPVTPGPVLPGPVMSGPVMPGPVMPGPVMPGPVMPGPGKPGPVTPGPAPSVMSGPLGSDRGPSIPAVVSGPIGSARAARTAVVPAPGTITGQRAGSRPAPSAAAPDPATFWSSPPPAAGAVSADDLWSGLQAPSLLSPGAAPGRDLQRVAATGLMGLGLLALAGTAGASAWRRLAISWARTPRT